MPRTTTLAIALLVMGGCHSVGASSYSQCGQDLFEEALGNQTSAPSFVLITVIDGKSGEGRQVCTEAPFLLGALHRELGLGYR